MTIAKLEWTQRTTPQNKDPEQNPLTQWTQQNKKRIKSNS